MARKPTKSDIEFIEESLIDLKVQLDNIKTYLETNPWIDIVDDDSKQQREFKFQSGLYDKYNAWLEKYMNLSGIVDFYNEANKEDEEELRKGYKDNELMEKLKRGEI